MTTTAGGWSAITASVRGASHERSGKPNQDAVRVVQAGGSVPGLVAAVCDGHGGNRYVRSDVGSRLGAETACELGKRALKDLGTAPGSEAVSAYLLNELAPAIVERWRDQVLRHVADAPFTAEEAQAAGGVVLDDDPHISYGCTLVLAVASKEWVGLLQIGDGDAVVVNGAVATEPVPGDERLVGGETTSLCLPGAAGDARAAVLSAPLPETVMLSSDGYANSFASPTWFQDAGLDMRDQLARNGLDGVESRLAGWLADSAVAGGDDVSMALLHREGATAAPVSAAMPTTADKTVRAPAPPAATASSPPPQPAEGRSFGVVPLAVALVAGLLVGVLGGWVVGGGSGESATPSTVPTTVTTASTTTAPSAPTTPNVDLREGDVVLTFLPIPPIGSDTGQAGTQPQLLSGGSVIIVNTLRPNEPDPRRLSDASTAPAYPPEGWRFGDRSLDPTSNRQRRITGIVSYATYGDYVYGVTTGSTLNVYDRTGQPLPPGEDVKPIPAVSGSIGSPAPGGSTPPTASGGSTTSTKPGASTPSTDAPKTTNSSPGGD